MISRSRLLPLMFSLIAFVGPFQAIWAAPSGPAITTSGRLVDVKGAGIGDVSIFLWDKEGELSLTTKSLDDGSFTFTHPSAGKLTLEVLPPLKTSLATAFIDDIPGAQNRKIVVEMHLGHLVSGRVTHDGKGLKGVSISVQPVEFDKHGKPVSLSSMDQITRINGGGATTSGKNGAFTIVLTPGHKHLTLLNSKYPKYEKKVEHDLTVRENMNIGALHL